MKTCEKCQRPEVCKYAGNCLKPPATEEQIASRSAADCSALFVFDGYLMQPAEPAFPDHVLVLGSAYFMVPDGAYYWSIGHGETGWWNAEDEKGKPMRELLYSIPKASAMLGRTWDAIKDVVFKPNR